MPTMIPNTHRPIDKSTQPEYRQSPSYTVIIGFSYLSYCLPKHIIPIPPRMMMTDVIITPTLNPLSPNRSYRKRRKLNPLLRSPVISNTHFHRRIAPIRSKTPRAIIIKPPLVGVMLLKKSGSLFIFSLLLVSITNPFLSIPKTPRRKAGTTPNKSATPESLCTIRFAGNGSSRRSGILSDSAVGRKLKEV